MAIIPFIATTVLPGQPMTAQAWNDIVNAIAAIIGHIDATESTSVRVAITNAGIDPLKTRITAVRDDGLTAEAVAPVPPSSEFVFTALKPGAYALRAEAPGF